MSKTYETILVEKEDGITWVIFNRPEKRNAMSPQMHFDMNDALSSLAHDPDTDVYVLAHVYEGPKKGSPHNHGASWAVYGTAKAVTNMTEWRRTNPESEEKAVLEPVEHYALGPGQTRAYGPGVLHSTEHPGKAWVIRVTGTDVDAIPRFRFKAERDRIVEKV